MSKPAQCGFVLLLTNFVVGSVLLREAIANEDLGAAPDHPLVVAAVASVDRLLDRTVDVMRTHGAATTRDTIVSRIKLYGLLLGLNVETPWFDPTKPVGILLFYDAEMFAPSEAAPAEKPAEGEAASASAPSGLFGAMSEAGLSSKRFVVFLPVKDYQQMLALGKLTPVAGKANCFRDDKGAEQFLRRFGHYVVIGLDADTVDHCPDPRELVRNVLGKNDVAVSLQSKGLPPLLRSLGAEGIKSVYDAGLQRRDDEQERDYLLRRALGDIARELLDLAMTQVDEATFGIRMDADVRSIIELEVNGTAEGKLAKFAAEMTPKKSAFEPLWNADYDQSLGISLALPQRHAKPLAAAIRNYVATASEAADLGTLMLNGPLINSGCRMLETNQFELLCTGEREGDANVLLYGVKIPTNRDLPQQFETWFRGLTADNALGVTTTTLEGMPLYHIQTIPFLGDAFGAILSEAAGGGDWGKAETPSHSWLMATQDAIWFCSRAGLDDDTIPTLLHRAIDTKTLASPNDKNRRTFAPFRMSVHTGHWKGVSADHYKEQAPRLADAEIERIVAQQEKRQKLYEMHSDGISVELLPTARGLKLTMAFDAVYAVLVPQMIIETVFGITQLRPADDLWSAAVRRHFASVAE